MLTKLRERVRSSSIGARIQERALSVRIDDRRRDMLRRAVTYGGCHLVALVFITVAIRAISGLLFPREPVAAGLIAAIWIAAALSTILYATTLPLPFWAAVDKNYFSLKSTLAAVLVPVGLLIIVSLPSLPSMSLVFLFLLVCLFEEFLAYETLKLLRSFRASLARRPSLNPLPFLFAASLSILLLAMQLFPILDLNYTFVQNRTQYNNFGAYLRSAQTYMSSGVLFAVLEPATAERAARFVRFEETNIGDDVGYVVIQSIATLLKLDPSVRTNMEINRAVFFVGVMTLALAAGGLVARSAVGPMVIGLSLLMAHPALHATLYDFADQHGAATGLGLIALGLMFVMPVVGRYCSMSALMWFGISVGLMAGGLGLVRQSVGLSLLAASLIVSFFVTSHPRGIRAFALALSILVGSSTVGLALNQVLAYRDTVLDIRTPVRSDAAHGAWFSLLGGAGLRDESLGIQFVDSSLYRAVAQEAPLFEATDIDPVARRILLRYIQQDPVTFIRVLLAKTFWFLYLIVERAGPIWSGSLWALLTAAVIAVPLELLVRVRFAQASAGRPSSGSWVVASGATFAAAVYCAMTAVVPILVQPEQFIGESSAVLLAAVVGTVYVIGFQLVRLAIDRIPASSAMGEDSYVGVNP